MRNQLLDVFVCGFGFNFANGPHQVGAIRRALPQFLASSAVFFCDWDMGLILAISTIVVPSVLGASGKLNPDETLFMTSEEASWLGR